MIAETIAVLSVRAATGAISGTGWMWLCRSREAIGSLQSLGMCERGGQSPAAPGSPLADAPSGRQVEHFSLRIASGRTTWPPVRRRKMKRMLPLVACV
ncbi:hypothetical protein STAQ_27750 [Allostella sp. ATCC 35155]|nr:hypothetical protein STAQ_27750 [Stella sp. ATCC 35155]